METRWLHVTSEDFHALREAAKDVCVIPIGAVEKHGPHLPLGTDTFLARHLAYMASQMETVCVFPEIPFGDKSQGAPSTPAGTISLPMETEMLLLEQLCEQISRYGYKKILILNAHGGNCAWLTAFLEKLGNKKRDFVAGVYFVRVGTLIQMAKLLEEKGTGAIPELTAEDEQVLLDHYHSGVPTGHACFCETAFVMGCEPQTVKLERLGSESGKSLHKTDYFKEAGIEIRDDGWYIDYPNSYASEVDPVKCNERIGKAALRFKAEDVARAYKVFKEDENLWKWHEEWQKGW